jgi:hypothetical protein
MVQEDPLQFDTFSVLSSPSRSAESLFGSWNSLSTADLILIMPLAIQHLATEAFATSRIACIYLKGRVEDAI